MFVLKRGGAMVTTTCLGINLKTGKETISRGQNEEQLSS